MVNDFERLVALMAKKTSSTPEQVKDLFLHTFCSSLRNVKTQNHVVRVFGPLWVDCLNDLEQKRTQTRERMRRYRGSSQQETQDSQTPPQEEVKELPQEILALLERNAEGGFEGVVAHGKAFRSRVPTPDGGSCWLPVRPSPEEAALSRFNWYRDHKLPYTKWEQLIASTREEVQGDPQNMALWRKYGEGFVLYLAWSLGIEENVAGVPEEMPEEARAALLLIENDERANQLSAIQRRVLFSAKD